MKVQVALVLVLCLGVAIGESNGRRRSQRRRPPAEIPENAEQEKPESGKEKDTTVQKEVPPVVEQPKVDKEEEKQGEVTKPADVEDGGEKKKNQTRLSQLFVPRATRRPRPLPRGSSPRPPTLPSFIRNPNRQVGRTTLQKDSSSSSAQKVTSAPSSSRSTAKEASSSSGRRRSTAAPAASASDGSKPRFGSSSQKPARSNFRRSS